jgi:hypothetical protein
MIMWDMHDHTTEEQARKNRDSSNGKSFSVENTTTSDDANDVNISMESSGVVYDTARPDKSTSGTGECSHGGHDRCICGMDESRG